MKKNWDSLLAALAGFAIIILYTRHGGVGISPDSTVYMSAAENFHNNGHFSEFADNPVTDFPIFYPFFLSIVMWLTNLKPLVFAPYLNATLFGTVIFLSGVMMERFTFQSKWYKAAILSCIVLSPGLLEDYSMLWSETIFIILLLLFLIKLNDYLPSNSRKALIIAAVFASLAALTRYAGVTIIATGGLLILVNQKIILGKRIGDFFLFSVISSLPLAINLITNYFASGTLTGGRERSLTAFTQNLHNAGSVFCDWLPFLSGHYSFATVLICLIIAGLIIICMRTLLRNKIIVGYVDLSAVFSLIYILFMIVMASISRQEDLNSRFLTPVFIPLLWCGSSWIISSYQRSKKILFVIVGVILFLCFQYNQLKADAENWDGIKDAGIPGYTEDPWRYSETVQYIQKNLALFQKDFTIYSDAPGAVYFFTGRPGLLLPHKDSKEEQQEFLEDNKCYVVWFKQGKDNDVIDESFLTVIKKMRPINQFNDGTIYISDK